MSAAALQERIQNRTATVAVMGLGYGGLPLAHAYDVATRFIALLEGCGSKLVIDARNPAKAIADRAKIVKA